MDPILKRIVDKINDESLRALTIDLVKNPSIHIGATTYTGLSLGTAPASRRRHHSYPRGLIQHIVGSSKIALTLCDIVEQIYRSDVDRDVVLTAIVVHDVMKPLTYALKGECFEASQLGERMDHLTLVVAELIRRGFPLEVVHAVAAHHGRSGPINPRTVEALICFLADSTDADLNGEVLTAAKIMVERCVDERIEGLNAEEACTIIHAHEKQGCGGVTSKLKEILESREST